MRIFLRMYALATTDLTVLRDKVLLPPPSFSHLFTLGDVLVDPEGVPVESLEPCSQSPLQCPDVVSQQLRLRTTGGSIAYEQLYNSNLSLS